MIENFNQSCLIHTFETSDEWLSERKKHITATDVSVILGVNPYCSPLELWAQKTGRFPAIEQNEAMAFGNQMEPVIGKMFAEKHPDLIVEPFQKSALLVSEEYPLFSASLDFTADPIHEENFNGRRIVETKYVTHYGEDAWDDDAPLHYQFQVQAQFLVSGLTNGWIAAVFGGSGKYVEYPQEADAAVMEMIISECSEWWEKYVIAGQEPPATEKRDLSAFLKLHPNDNGKSIDLPVEMQLIDSRLQELNAIIKEAEKEKESLQESFKLAIGENTFGVIPGIAKYSFKTQDRKESLIKACQFRVLRRSAIKE